MPYHNLPTQGGRVIPMEYRIRGDETRCVLIVHGFASSKASYTAIQMLDHLESLGLAAVAIDLPCHGESDADFTALTVDNCLSDMAAAEDFIKSKLPGAEICHFGSSYGGYLSILRMARSGEGRRAFLRCVAVDMDRAFEADWAAIEAQLHQLGYALYDSGYGPFLKLSSAFFDSLRGRLVFGLKLPEGTRIEMIHGLADDVVDPHSAIAWAKEQNCPINLIPGADHRIANAEGLQTLIERTAAFFTKE